MSFLVDFSCLARKTRRVSTALNKRCMRALREHGAESWDMFGDDAPEGPLELRSELSEDELQVLYTAAAHIAGSEICDEPGLSVFRTLRDLTESRLIELELPREDNGYCLWKNHPESLPPPQPPLPYVPPREFTLEEKRQRLQDLVELERTNAGMKATPKMKRELVRADGTKIKF